MTQDGQPEPTAPPPDFARVLAARPGLTKEKLAAALGVEYDAEFRTQLDAACDKGIAHKIQDKYYPGQRKAY